MAKRKATDEDSGQPPTTKKSSRVMRREPKIEQPQKSTVKAPSQIESQAAHSPPIRTLFLQEEKGNLFDAPEDAVLIHACNCEGVWGRGIAAEFKERYPKAFSVYEAHCRDNVKSFLAGTALLISPQQETNSKRHFIGCLFTSVAKGRTKDKPAKILSNTEASMRDLIDQLAHYHQSHSPKSTQQQWELWMCQINSGLFNVPWRDTKEVIESLENPNGTIELPIMFMSRRRAR